jgi:hypothetical protein
MTTKIPTHTELKAKRDLQKQKELEVNRQLAMRMLSGKIVRTVILTALTIEAHDYLQPTTIYNKKLKRDGERFLAELEKVVENELGKLYDMNREFTMKIMTDIETVIDLLCQFDIGDYPFLVAVLNEFKNNKLKYIENSTENEENSHSK